MRSKTGREVNAVMVGNNPDSLLGEAEATLAVSREAISRPGGAWRNEAAQSEQSRAEQMKVMEGASEW